jgi:2-keto-4-pentenoate hydratase/2-oxohepta-3-ene-1,7-dioic acid hydratase in catechol pathway
MKFASYVRPDGVATYGVLVDDERLSELGGMPGVAPDLKTALTQGVLQTKQTGAATWKLAEVRLRPPIPNPGKILCVGHNYESHRQETGRAKTGHPSIFTRFADTLIAHGERLRLPAISECLDFEGELAVVIGRAGRLIRPEDAFQHVAGYACFNDASIRDWQWHTSQFIPGKNFPGTGAFGPWLVTADEVDLKALRVTTSLNGTTMQDQPVSDMIFPIPKLIAYISSFTPLAPGDVILTGTPGGVGAKREPPLWMRPGDEVTVRIGSLGPLVNVVAAEPT